MNDPLVLDLNISEQRWSYKHYTVAVFPYITVEGSAEAAGATLIRVDISVTSGGDTIGPEIQLISPTPELLTADNVTVTGRVTDNLAGVASLQAQLDEGVPFSVAIDGSGDFSFNTDYALDGSFDGSHTIRLTAIDSVGNISVNEETFILDTAVVEPTLIINALSGDGAIPAVINPGVAYRFTGSRFSASGPIELILVQGDAITSLGVVQLTLGTSSFSADIVIPTALPGGSLIEARQGNATLASVETTVLHAEEMITDLFITVFGRNPGPVNMSYWQTRTDKIGDALFGAMEFARLTYEAAALRMELVGAPTAVCEDGTLTARFTNAEPGETVEVHLVYKGTIVQSSTATAAPDGTATVGITVPNPLLPITFDGPAPSEDIEVLLVHREQAITQKLILNEGPRLLLKSAEANEGGYYYFSVRNVKADARVVVKLWMHTSGTDSEQLIQTLGRTDGSNTLNASNSKIQAPDWLHGPTKENGIEIDIWVANDDGSVDVTRGYRATLKDGGSRADIIAQLIRDNGTDSIEAELRVLLTEEERILADQLLGDDWEGNAAAIGEALGDHIIQGGGYGGDLLDSFAREGVSPRLFNVLLSSLGISVDQHSTFQTLASDLSEAHANAPQDTAEASKDSVDIRLITPKDKPGDGFGPGDFYEGHLGTDYNVGLSGVAGTAVLAPVSGRIRTFDRIYAKDGDPFGPYGTVVAIEVDVPLTRKFVREGGDPRVVNRNHPDDDFGTITVFLGHLDLDPAGKPPLTFVQGSRIEAGTTIGYIGTYKADSLGTGGSASNGAHIHVGILPWGLGMLSANQLPTMINGAGRFSAFPGRGGTRDSNVNQIGTSDLIVPPTDIRGWQQLSS